ncbi:Transcriptional regulator, DeoR family [[Actinomadura] parvosata subsp. kistnae]|uniref:Transcriptional regulator n=1 Tax=[Actinomadura] parvosata subsp. kistnae TaxID=1909395 RepID=A0A1V0A1N8_9ACTN|nr:WYL domain-containing protein [Nonomuraea sp. ATCC 55076]AQZ64103.1 transcriptional regulator [Nonomuraea sp. ATCC 55076]SPL87419.1 Transcriptional regulator, DeoR family [Actinomadura parvosata subsp. kistnae]
MRAARLMSLVLLLQGRGGMTAAELAKELEVSERTVHRDVLALSEAGVPVYADRGRGGGYRLLDGYRTRLTGLDRAEAEALFLSGVPAALREMGLQDVAATARLKAAAALSPALRDAPATAAQRFHLDAPGWFAADDPPPAALAPLARAVWGDRRVAAAYKDEPRVLEPYGLVLKAGAWYLVARQRARFLIFRVHRFGEISVLEEQFDRDPGFDLAAFWKEQAASFTRSLLREVVTLRLSERGRRMLRHVADPAALEDALASLRPDGTVRLAVESVEVAFSQVLRFGPEAEVLDPPELRAMAAEAAARMARLYQSPPQDQR